MQVQITNWSSSIPVESPEQIKYFNNFKTAVVSVLNLSANLKWQVEVFKIASPTERMSDPPSHVLVCFIFTSLSVDPAKVTALQNKLNSQVFWAALNSLGFSASTKPQQLISTSNQKQLSVDVRVGLGSAVLTIVVLAYVYKRFACRSGSVNSKIDAKSALANDDGMHLLPVSQ